MQVAHVSPFQGTWYPERRAELERLLESKFDESRARIPAFPFTDAFAFVTPHAGPAYSGTVAAAVYRAIEQMQPDHVIVLAFPHHGGLRGVAVPDTAAISTPLGEVRLADIGTDFPRLPESRVCDHSFEIQLPFLQKAAPRAKVSALYAGRFTETERRRAAAALAAAWKPGAVFIASSDFTHYGRDFGFVPFPRDLTIAKRLHDLDHDCIDAAGTLDSALFLKTLEDTGATVCGSQPIALLLDVLQHLDPAAACQFTLDYQTSGEITGDFEHSVSYAALAYCRPESLTLDAADREALLDSAERTLALLRSSGRADPVAARGSRALDARRSVFVSLHQGEELLGCIGNCEGRDPLRYEVPNLALSAALDDPRFRPAAEVRGLIEIEISVLTPFQPIVAPRQIEMGRHGAFLRVGERSSLLLPQVAEGRDWVGEQFLAALSRKCLLGPQAWKDPKARLYRFEAQVFSRHGTRRGFSS